MENITKSLQIVGQLRAACLEMARGFEQMEERAAEITPDTWAEAVNALAETLAVARVSWADLVAERAASASGPAEYSIQLLDAAGMPSAGASFPAADDDAAEDEARALAIMHDWATRATLLAKRSGRKWTIRVGA